MIDSRFDSIYFKGKDSLPAVLLLHGYGGNTLEMRELASSLHSAGHTVLCPLYSGHGRHNFRTFLNTKVSLWYDEALESYDQLQSFGYDKIIVMGLSLGGAFTIRMGMDRSPFALVSMSAPVYGFDPLTLLDNCRNEVNNNDDIIEKDKERYSTIFYHQKVEISAFYDYIKDPTHLKSITCPLYIVQGLLDHKRFVDSAYYLDEHISSTHHLETFEHSSHVITMGPEKEDLFKKIRLYINDLHSTFEQ